MTKEKKKKGFKHKFYKLFKGKQNAAQRAMHAEQLKIDKLANACERVKDRLEKLQELHNSMIDQSMSQMYIHSSESYRQSVSVVNDLMNFN